MLDGCELEDGEEFVNITVHPSSNSVHSDSLSVGGDIAKDRGLKVTSPVSGAAQLLRPKSATDLSSMLLSSGRPKQGSAESTTPRSSPRLKRRSVGTAPQVGNFQRGILSFLFPLGVSTIRDQG